MRDYPYDKMCWECRRTGEESFEPTGKSVSLLVSQSEAAVSFSHYAGLHGLDSRLRLPDLCSLAGLPESARCRVALLAISVIWGGYATGGDPRSLFFRKSPKRPLSAHVRIFRATNANALWKVTHGCSLGVLTGAWGGDEGVTATAEGCR